MFNKKIQPEVLLIYTYVEVHLEKQQLKASIHNILEEVHHMEHQPCNKDLLVEHKLEDYPLVENC